MNENCRFKGPRSCTALKKLYCKLEPNKPCPFHKPPEAVKPADKEAENNEQSGADKHTTKMV